MKAKRPPSAKRGLIVCSLAVLAVLGVVVGVLLAIKPNPASKKPYTPTAYSEADSPFSTAQFVRFFGETAVAEPALDFGGNTATRYRYHHRSQEPFYVIDSQDFFEIAWQFNPDNPATPQAQIAERFTHSLLGNETLGNGATFWANLTNPPTALPDGVVLAECRHQLCQVVFEKAVFEKVKYTK